MKKEDNSKGTGYHFLGMEKIDGGDRRWDRDGDGKLDWFEEHKRRAFDIEMMKDIERDK